MPTPPRLNALTWGLMLLGLAALIAAPYYFYPLFLIKLLCFSLFACAFNLLMGSAGLLSFGHAAFYGTAAYIAAHSAKIWGFPFEVAVLSGVGAAAVLGIIFGYVSIRQRGGDSGRSRLSCPVGPA